MRQPRHSIRERALWRSQLLIAVGHHISKVDCRSWWQGATGGVMLFGWDEFSPEDSQEILLDAVIIGAGRGGATLGYALARKGLKVLFLERGSAQTLFPESLHEGRLKRLLGWERREERLAAMGRWPRPITMMRGGQAIHFLAP